MCNSLILAYYFWQQWCWACTYSYTFKSVIFESVKVKIFSSVRMIPIIGLVLWSSEVDQMLIWRWSDVFWYSTIRFCLVNYYYDIRCLVIVKYQKTSDQLLMTKGPGSIAVISEKWHFWEGIQILESVIIESASVSAQCPNVPTMYIGPVFLVLLVWKVKVNLSLSNSSLSN